MEKIPISVLWNGDEKTYKKVFIELCELGNELRVSVEEMQRKMVVFEKEMNAKIGEINSCLDGLEDFKKEIVITKDLKTKILERLLPVLYGVIGGGGAIAALLQVLYS